MTNALTAVNILMLIAGIGGWVAIILLEHIFHRDVSPNILAALLGISLALVLLGLGIWTGKDLIQVRALAAVLLVVAEVGLVRDEMTRA